MSWLAEKPHLEEVAIVLVMSFGARVCAAVIEGVEPERQVLACEADK